MKNLIHNLRSRFELLSLRERVLCTLLVWALIYALFSLIFFRPVNNQRTEYLNKVKEAKSTIASLELQIDAVDKIAQSPLYQEWKKQHTTFEAMQKHYKTLIGNFSASNWHEVIKTIVDNHPNITLAHIENSKEMPFSSESNTDANTAIYQQHLTLVVYGDYFNTIKYLQNIEKVLPNLHWGTLKYEVITYPSARITIGLSVFYGKNIKK